jgi:hypothetical protein
MWGKTKKKKHMEKLQYFPIYFRVLVIYIDTHTIS